MKTPVSATFPGGGGGGWLPSQSTGSSSISSHSTGSSTSTIQNQFTGNSRPALTIEPNHTGNALAMLNRRSGSVSPTKGMLGGTVLVNRTLSMKKAVRPRPKSVSVLPRFGAAGTGTYGRSMELVRETTGASIAGQQTGETTSH
jgi:hypothetical protein